MTKRRLSRIHACLLFLCFSMSNSNHNWNVCRARGWLLLLSHIFSHAWIKILGASGPYWFLNLRAYSLWTNQNSDRFRGCMSSLQLFNKYICQICVLSKQIEDLTMFLLCNPTAQYLSSKSWACNFDYGQLFYLESRSAAHHVGFPPLCSLSTTKTPLTCIIECRNDQ